MVVSNFSHNDVSWVPFCCIFDNFTKFSKLFTVPLLDRLFPQQSTVICDMLLWHTRHTSGGFFHHVFLCQGIQVTATTPSSTAVRLDTGVVSLEVSNSAPSSGLLPGQLRRSKYSVNLLYMNKFIYTWNIFIHKREVSEETVVLLRCIMRWFAFTMILIYNVNWPPGEKFLKSEW